MKGDKGTCTITAPDVFVRRTKFNTKKHAQDACDFHVAMGFAHADSVVYQCKQCDLWHFGKPEWAKLYSK